MVGVSFGPLVGLMIGTGEGYLVGFSLGLPLGVQLECPNHVFELPGMLMGVPLVLWLVSEAVRCLCYCHHPMYFHEAT